MGTRLRFSLSRVAASGKTGSIGREDWAERVVVPAGGAGAADFQSAGRRAGGCTGIAEMTVE